LKVLKLANLNGLGIHVVALRYENEAEYRYIYCTELSYEAKTIIKLFQQRWLVEVFFNDWKNCEGWGQESMQQGEEKANRGVLFSLLIDYCLLFHPEQEKAIKAGKPACTVGSLLEKIRIRHHLQEIERILLSNNPLEEYKKYEINIETYFRTRASTRHYSGRISENLAPSPSLAKKYARSA